MRYSPLPGLEVAVKHFPTVPINILQSYAVLCELVHSMQYCLHTILTSNGFCHEIISLLAHVICAQW